MLLQNLHRRYLYSYQITIFTRFKTENPKLPNCNNFGALSANNPDPRLDNTPTNDNELHQIICNNFKIDYF